jgi:hypothetical protein
MWPPAYFFQQAGSLGGKRAMAQNQKVDIVTVAMLREAPASASFIDAE